MNAVKLATLPLWQGWILTGPNSIETLKKVDWPLPDGLLSAIETAKALVARTGSDEFLAFSKDRSVVPVGVGCFERYDAIFCLSGSSWQSVMLQLCPFDFERMQPGEWQMLVVAGVNCWLYLSADAAETLLLGCDPGFAAYLKQTVEAVINDVGQNSAY